MNKMRELQNKLDALEQLIDVQEKSIIEQTKKLYAEIEKRKIVEEKLIQKNREIIDFADMLTHDLKNPLVGIKSAFDMLKLEPVLQTKKDILEILEIGIQSTRYMQGLIGDLLEIARLESGGKELEIKLVNVKEIVDGVLAQLHFGSNSRNTQICTDVDIQAFADASALTKTLMNLIGNALAYLDDKSVHKIAISAHYQNGNALFSIQDNGMGIPLANQAGIFDKFKRGDNVKSRKGTGLGLAICKGIIENHGGKIWFDSEEGKGTTFFFNLPDVHLS
ncbi:MAG: HAMP domain-containing sensor histidine kinase [Chitinivibrionales bacterium]|nr:HAMP domain-containing sensor histidine kinase [Chitinivibrionales bacterium]